MSSPRMLGEQEPEWDFQADGPLECATTAAGAPCAAVADGARNISIVDAEGRLTGSLRAGQRVRLLRATQDGTLFAGLAGEGIVYAFDREGDLRWRVEFGDRITDIALLPFLHRLVAVSDDGGIHLHDWETHQSVVGQIEWSVQSVSVGQTEPPVIAVADGEGHVALLDGEANVRWQKSTGGSTGPVRLDMAGKKLLLPALADGVRVFDLGGAEVAGMGFGGAVRRVEPTPDGQRFVVETAGAELILTTADAQTLWRKQFARSPVDWALGDEGRLLVLARGGRTLEAHRMPSAGQEMRQPTPPPEEPGRVAQTEGDVSAAEEPSGGEDRVQWRRPAPKGRGRVRMLLGEGGEYALVAYVSGRATVYDGGGNQVLEAELDAPLHVMPSMPRHSFGLWARKEVVLLEPEGPSRKSFSLGGEVLHCDCARDLRLVCSVDREGVLRCFRDGSLLWQRNLGTFVTGLFVSPGGKVILAADETGRYRYYNADGRLMHKFRFSGEEMHKCYGLNERFSVFCSEKGHVVVVGNEGHRLWSARPLGVLEDVELLNGLISIYRGSGTCAVIDPEDDEVWEVWPDSGELRLRKRPDSDPLLFSIEGRVLELQAGQRSDMRSVWQVSCDKDIQAFCVDREGTAALVLAGDELCMIR